MAASSDSASPSSTSESACDSCALTAPPRLERRGVRGEPDFFSKPMLGGGLGCRSSAILAKSRGLVLRPSVPTRAAIELAPMGLVAMASASGPEFAEGVRFGSDGVCFMRQL
jgi:hypothetical protein